MNLPCFDQTKMSKHASVWRDPFPRIAANKAKTLVSSINKQSQLSYELYCDCWMLEFADNMVACNGCDTWVHLHCAGFHNVCDVPEIYV